MAAFSFLGRYTVEFTNSKISHPGLNYEEIREIGNIIHHYLRPSELMNILLEDLAIPYETADEMGLKMIQVEINKTRKTIYSGSYSKMELTFMTDTCTSIHSELKNALEQKFRQQRVLYYSPKRGKITLKLELYSSRVILAHLTIK